jgi:hypothetical protein
MGRFRVFCDTILLVTVVSCCNHPLLIGRKVVLPPQLLDLGWMCFVPSSLPYSGKKGSGVLRIQRGVQRWAQNSGAHSFVPKASGERPIR